MTQKLLPSNPCIMFRFTIKAVKVREEALYTARVSKYRRCKSPAIFGSFIDNTILAFCSADVRGSLHFLYLNYFILLAWIGVETFLLNTV